MQIKVIDPLVEIEWLHFISRNPKSTIFHHPAWLRAGSAQYNYKYYAACIYSDENNIIAGIVFCELKDILGKKRWISLPFTDFCDPLFEDKSELVKLLEFLNNEAHKKNINSIELRCNLPENEIFFPKHEYTTHSLELKKELKLTFDKLKNTPVMRNVRKSQKEGLTSEISVTMQAMEEFYRLHLKTRKKLGAPIQPKNFFNNIMVHIINNNLGFFVVIRKDKIPVSAGLFFNYNNTAVYKYGASDSKYLNYRPNNLLLWAAIEESVCRGSSCFNFGKTDVDNEGLRKFKSGWGSVEEKLDFNYYPASPGNGFMYKIKENIVSPIIKSSPTFVCRAIGEVAYKYFPSL